MIRWLLERLRAALDRFRRPEPPIDDDFEDHIELPPKDEG